MDIDAERNERVGWRGNGEEVGAAGKVAEREGIGWCERRGVRVREGTEDGVGGGGESRWV